MKISPIIKEIPTGTEENPIGKDGKETEETPIGTENTSVGKETGKTPTKTNPSAAATADPVTAPTTTEPPTTASTDPELTI